MSTTPDPSQLGTFCNPVTIDDFYKPQPEPPAQGATPAPAPAPAPSGQLTDPEAPGSLVLNDLSSVPVQEPPAAPPDNSEAKGASLMANILKTFDAIEAEAQNFQNTLTAIGALASDIDRIRNLWSDASSIGSAIGDMRNLAASTFIRDPETLAAFDKLKSEKIDPVLNWVTAVNRLTTDGISLDALGGGSFGDLQTVAAGIDAISQNVLGLKFGESLQTYLSHVTDTWRNVQTDLDQANQVLMAAEQLANAAPTILLAACHAIPALDLQLKGLYDSITGMFAGVDVLSFFKLPHMSLVFKPPQIPLFENLGKYQGMKLNFDPKAAWNECAGPWQTADVYGPNAIPYVKPNPDAVRNGLSALGSAKSAIMSGANGIGNLVEGAPKTLDPARAEIEAFTGMMTHVAPNPTHVSVDNVPKLGAKLGFTVPSTIQDADLPVNASKLSVGNFHALATDPVTGEDSEVPGVPGAAAALENQTTCAAELAGSIKCAQELSDIAATAAANMRALGPGATEADARAALIELLGACQATLLLTNIAADANLSPDKIPPALLHYYLCERRDRFDGTYQPPNTPDDCTDGADKVVDTDPGQPHSPGSVGGENNPDGGSPADRLDDLPGSMTPPGWYSPGQEAVLAQFVDASVEVKLADLVFALLSPSEADWRAYQLLAGVDALLDSIRPQAEAHARLVQKATQQGYLANSPYTWLGEGLQLVGSSSILAMTKEFLRHGDIDIRPVAHWLAALALIDFAVPFPDDLTLEERAAANVSFDYTAVNRQDLSGPIAAWRLRADLIGRQLGFEFVVALAILILLSRGKDALRRELPEETLVAIGKAAKELASYMTHPESIEPVLEALSE